MDEIEKQVDFYNTLDQELWFISEIMVSNALFLLQHWFY